MKITGLKVDGYGVWSGLELQGLSEGINVLYGPNEAGKTTLLQFVRSVLYGFSPDRRKYLPPLHGGTPGGSLQLSGPNGHFQLERHRADDGDPASNDLVELTASDGTRQGEHLVKVLLCDIDEAIYNNVFAVGLREVQELATLSDTEAAQLLYDLTAGLDRVSLVEVMRELDTSRNRILDRDGGKCQVGQLLTQRATLRKEIEELGKLTRRYGRLAADRNQLQREIVRLEEENTQTEHHAQVVELAIELRERWAQRDDLDAQLAALGLVRSMPEGAVQRLDEIRSRMQKHQLRIEQIQQRREDYRHQAADLKLNESLLRHAMRIEGLGDQQAWISTLQEQVIELETEVGQLQSSLDTEHQQLGLGNTAQPVVLPELSGGRLAKMRAAARSLRQCRGQMAEAREEQAAAEREVQSLTGKISAALSTRNASDLAATTDRAGNLVAGLSRRLQIDEQSDEMDRYKSDLEKQHRRLIDRRMMPAWILGALGIVFVLGVVLIMAGLFMPASVTGSLGWALSLLGLIALGGAAGTKFLLERSNVRQLETTEKQLLMLQSQMEQAQQERDALDERLPRGGGPLAVRLLAAENDLAELENLAPLETERTAAGQQAQAAADRAKRAEQGAAEAKQRWRHTLVAVGLPENLVPKQIRKLIRRSESIRQTQRRLDDRREELQRRRRELDLIVGQIAQLAENAGVSLDGDPSQQLRLLSEELARQETSQQRRETLRRESRKIRRKQAKHEEALGRLKHRRRELFRQVDAENEQQFRQRALETSRAEVLQKDRDAVAREIAAAIGDGCPEEAVGRELQTHSQQILETRRDEFLERMAAMEKELQQRFERRGRLAEQLQALADDRQLAEKQLELATVEKRLEEAVGRWQVLAVTGRVLEGIRAVYEKERQPETLQEASGYLNRLTRGRYCRVWTPLGEDVLRIDDAGGNALPVEMLSRGTREQLFLALRLALVACYSRQGAPLPLVLDDVLVNFDADRAKAAATVLRDFANAGHQLLVFTCHEHILKLFKSLKVPVSRLPANADSAPDPVVFEQQEAKKSRKSNRKKAAESPKAEPPKTASPQQDPQPDVVAQVIAEADDEPIDDEIAVIEPIDDEILVITPNEVDVYDPADETPRWEEEKTEEETAEEEPEDIPEVEPDDEWEEDIEGEADDEDAEDYDEADLEDDDWEEVDKEEDEYEDDEDEGEEYEEEDDDAAEAA